jgi:hypothetical protein
MALIAKSTGQRDFGERRLSFAEQSLRPLDALPGEPVVWRLTNGFSKSPAELRGRQAAFSRYLREALAAREIARQKLFGPPLLPPCQSSDDWPWRSREPSVGRGDMMPNGEYEVIDEDLVGAGWCLKDGKQGASNVEQEGICVTDGWPIAQLVDPRTLGLIGNRV